MRVPAGVRRRSHVDILLRRHGAGLLSRMRWVNLGLAFDLLFSEGKVGNVLNNTLSEWSFESLIDMLTVREIDEPVLEVVTKREHSGMLGRGTSN